MTAVEATLRQELADLRRINAELQRQLSDREHAAPDELHQLFTTSHGLLGIGTLDGYFKHLSPGWWDVLGFTNEELTAEPFLNFVHPDDRDATLAAAQGLSEGREAIGFTNRYRTAQGAYRWLEWTALPLVERQIMYLLARDITETKQAELMIQMQAEALTELSTPLIPISDRVLAMPLIGTMDTRRAHQVMETLLNGITARRAEVAILDITGVAGVDTHVADALLRVAKAAKLLGAEVVLTGIRPEVAQTLVMLGTDLEGIVTRGNLQAGIEYATHRK